MHLICRSTLIFLLSKLCTYYCKEIASSQDAMDYLQQFGYFGSAPRHTVVSYALPTIGQTEMFNKGLAMFQTFAGLNQSGVFDKETRNVMNMPRCGMAERMENMENKYINMTSLSHKIKKPRRWRASRIYYMIQNLPDSLDMNQFIVREEIRKAFRLWENVANIRCIELDKNSDKHAEIDIMFASREHGDGIRNAFGQDMLGNVVAHAFFPSHRDYDGDVHFDNERTWTAFNSSGINLYQVAAHEIGHALGLDHSRFPDSVMHMNIRDKFDSNFQLHEDDIQGIQKLYGVKRKVTNRRKPHRPIVQSKKDAAVFDPKMNVINLNAVIPLPVRDQPERDEISPVLNNFWKCFSLSGNESNVHKQNAANCYKDNVIRLLYSLKII